MSILNWIDDQVLEEAVRNLLRRAKDARDEASTRMAKNVVDPFSSLVLATTFDLDKADALAKIQEINSISKSISNAIGDFHQEILGEVRGFKNHDAGYDLERARKKIIAEVKNKHNTMNSTNRKQVIDDLDTAIRQKAGDWTAYLVIIIPSKPRRYMKKLTRREVYEIDGASFYELATGDKTALHDLYYAVEKVVTKRQRQRARNKSMLEYSGILEYCKGALTAGIPE